MEMNEAQHIFFLTSEYIPPSRLLDKLAVSSKVCDLVRASWSSPSLLAAKDFLSKDRGVASDGSSSHPSLSIIKNVNSEMDQEL
jgi:hypothetical protein